MASEFELISTLFAPLSKGLSTDELGIGDDGAVLNVPQNHQLVVVTDTLVSGVHFPKETKAFDVAWKAVAVNLSDLAAMGAKPGFYSLALTLPNNNQAWLNDFSEGLKAISALHKLPLVGGDTTKGPLTITVTAQGFIERGKAVRRSNAKAGDYICVTNTIGDGALGLLVVLDKLPGLVKDKLSQSEIDYLLKALNQPIPQLNMGMKLPGLANSAIDISDGLLADLGHILEETNKRKVDAEPWICAKVDIDKVPLSLAAQRYVEITQDWKTILTGGDDYQLCFTLNPQDYAEAKKVAEDLGISISKIGELIESTSLKVQGAKGLSKIELELNSQPYTIESSNGYLHF